MDNLFNQIATFLNISLGPSRNNECFQRQHNLFEAQE